MQRHGCCAYVRVVPSHVGVVLMYAPLTMFYSLPLSSVVFVPCMERNCFINGYLSLIYYYSVAFSPQANYTDRATAACRRS
jgi:hypothetical protein